jgi:hypothetical protein
MLPRARRDALVGSGPGARGVPDVCVGSLRISITCHTNACICSENESYVVVRDHGMPLEAVKDFSCDCMYVCMFCT